ncbi:MAG: PEP-CTERM sorting domain-containing protein [Pirellulales bacterium]|nr:PEP-CTERM sorting domain-containing protein [Pirellulales bacterium]
MRKRERAVPRWIPWKQGIVTATVLVVGLATSICWGATKARVYEMGESDPGAAIGNEVDLTNGTVDIQSGTSSYGDDDMGEFVNLMPDGFLSLPTYVEGREGPGSLAIDFNATEGNVTTLKSARIDPRDWSPNAWAILSQGWILPDSDLSGTRQTVWRCGTDLGGVAITDTGYWELMSGGAAGSIVSNVQVEFDTWTHVAVMRTGNNGRLYIDGSIAVRNDGYWNGSGTTVVGANEDNTDPFDGSIDDFNLSHFSDGYFTVSIDIDFFEGITFSGVTGDVDQDGFVNQTDYEIWSDNAGFDNGFGAGDPGTLVKGDVDQNGRVNYFDFMVINNEAAAAGTPLDLGGVPEPASILLLLAGAALIGASRYLRRIPFLGGVAMIAVVCLMLGSTAQADVVIAEDFYYNQPTKPVGQGGGFSMQDYGGGQNGPAGNWIGEWGSSGDAIINGPDHEPVENQYMAEFGPTYGALTFLYRNYGFSGLANDQTLYFSVSIRGPETTTTPNARMYLSSFDDTVESPTQISMGLGGGFYVGYLGETMTSGSVATTDLLYHRFIGKLQINASGANERLTVWIDPTGVETGPESISVEADVITGLDAMNGELVLRGDVTTGSPFWWDDMAVATTWEEAATLAVPRLALQVNTDTGNVSLINDTGFDFNLNYYEVLSASGSLDPTSWNSLDEQGIDGGAWMENNPSTKAIRESYFLGATTLANGAQFNLGTAFDTSKGTQDLVARFGTDLGLLNLTTIEYVTGGDIADFDGDSDVDGADFLIWQNGFGMTTGATLADGDANRDGAVNGTDLAIWKDQFGTGGGGLAAVAIPEPSTGLLVLLTGALAAWIRPRRGS